MPNFIHDGCRLHYTQEGAGPALLLLHGLGGNTENWILQRQAFADSHRVLAIDLPGHGRSEGKDISFLDYWTAIGALLDHLEIERTAICGLSKGARAGLMFAARHSARVERIIVVNAFVHLQSADRQARLDLYDLLIHPNGGRAWAERLLDAMGVRANPAIVRGFIRSLDKIDPLHIRTRFNQLIEFDQRPELEMIDCPVLLVRGDRDGFVPRYCLDELRQLLPSPRIASMPHCGHLPYLENPSAFNTILAEFLSETLA